MLYKILLESHSGFRYVVFILLVAAVLMALKGRLSGSSYTEGSRKLNLFTMISGHIQLLIGIFLYFQSPWVQFANMKDAVVRYWTAEHSVMMLVAIALLTIGHSRSKKLQTAIAKHQAIAVFYGIALLVIVAAIVMSRRPFFGMTH